jgi:RHS repeat-associated protein
MRDASGAVQIQLANLHGDIAATTSSDLGTQPGLLATVDTTEYGSLRDSSAVGSRRYGWLGLAERAADTPGGVLLMGVRVYNPTTGRFLQQDPVAGGSCNDYEYTCGDPVNARDLDGKMIINDGGGGYGGSSSSKKKQPGCAIMSCSQWLKIARALNVIYNFASYIPGWLCGVCGAISMVIGIMAGIAFIMGRRFATGFTLLAVAVAGYLLGKGATKVFKYLQRRFVGKIVYVKKMYSRSRGFHNLVVRTGFGRMLGWAVNSITNALTIVGSGSACGYDPRTSCG